MTQQSITVVGLDKLQRKLTPNLYDAEVKTILTKAAITGENLGKINAPVDTGRLRASVTHKVAAGNPLRSQYGTNVRYGRKLDKSKGRAYRYRRGPKRGSPTKGWLTNTLPEVAKAAQRFVKDAAASIEKRWGS